MNSIRRSKTGVLLLVVVSVIVSGCDEKKETQKWVDKVAPLKAEVFKQMDTQPYRATQHQAFKAYFAEIADLALKLNEDEKLKKELNKFVSRIDVSQVCSKALISQADWKALNSRCTKGRLYVCAEEVRAYGEIVSAVRTKLDATQQRRFDEASSCALVLKSE